MSPVAFCRPVLLPCRLGIPEQALHLGTHPRPVPVPGPPVLRRVAWRLANTHPRERLLVMAVKVYLGSFSAAHSEMTYEEADAFNVTSGGFLLIQRQHAGEQTDLAVFAPNAWLHAEIVREPRSPTL
jgi:hypothetical protein